MSLTAALPTADCVAEGGSPGLCLTPRSEHFPTHVVPEWERLEGHTHSYHHEVLVTMESRSPVLPSNPPSPPPPLSPTLISPPPFPTPPIPHSHPIPSHPLQLPEALG